MRHRTLCGALSALFLVLTLVLLVAKGLNFGIDFTGGALVQLQTDAPAQVVDIRQLASDANLNGLTIQNFGSDTEFLIRAPADDKADAFAGHIQKVLQDGGIMSHIRRVEFVGPQIGDELKQKGLLALLVSLLAVLVYVSLRFEFSYGIGTLAALVHDVMLTVGIFSLLQVELGLTVLAALLTIIGYSLNDTIVIFDRVRENRRRHRKMPLPDLLNQSLNETLRRTLMTSLTTLVAVLSLWLFGGEVIRSFAFTLLFGVLVGTYSSVFIAAPVYMLVHKKTAHWGTDEDNAQKA